MNTPVQFARRSRLKDYILPALVALAGAGAAYAGADTTFDPALTKFTYTRVFTIRSNPIRGNATRRKMIKYGMIGMLMMTVPAAQVSAQADALSFAIFEHRPSTFGFATDSTIG